jgi:ketosteroid isomerase-like protein
MQPHRVLGVALALAMMPLSAGSARAAPEDDVRQAFEQFIVAQNAHDVKAVGKLLVASPDFLWITRGAAIWGSDVALKRFASLYEGTWKLEPEMASMKVNLIAPDVARIYVPVVFMIGPAGQPAQPTRFLMNQVLVKTADGWRVSTILPIPAAAGKSD